MFEVLKQATDPLTPDYLYRMVKIEKEKVQVPINLNVPIIVSTNMDLTSDEGWDKALLPDRDALFNRSWPVVFPHDPFALWEWSVYLALSTYLTIGVSVRNPQGGAPIRQDNSLVVQANAITWFTENLNRLAVISPRTLRFIAQCMGRVVREDTRSLATVLSFLSSVPSNDPSLTTMQWTPSISRTSVTSNWQISFSLIPVCNPISGTQKRALRGREFPTFEYPRSPSWQPRC